MSLVPNQDVEFEGTQQLGGEEPPARDQALEQQEEEEQQESGEEQEACSRGTLQATQALSLSGELVPVTSAREAPDDTPNYYDWKDLFPELKALIDAKAEIAAECAQVAAWKAWPEKHYDEGGTQDWKVWKLCAGGVVEEFEGFGNRILIFCASDVEKSRSCLILYLCSTDNSPLRVATGSLCRTTVIQVCTQYASTILSTVQAL